MTDFGDIFLNIYQRFLSDIFDIGINEKIENNDFLKDIDEDDSVYSLKEKQQRLINKIFDINNFVPETEREIKSIYHNKEIPIYSNAVRSNFFGNYENIITEKIMTEGSIFENQLINQISKSMGESLFENSVENDFGYIYENTENSINKGLFNLCEDFEGININDAYYENSEGFLNTSVKNENSEGFLNTNIKNENKNSENRNVSLVLNNYVNSYGNDDSEKIVSMIAERIMEFIENSGEGTHI